MAQHIRDVMTGDPVVLPAGTPLQEAAQVMRERDIGDVLVSDETGLCGVVTDRDIVVRGVAEGAPDVRLGDICSRDVVTVSPDASIEEAMRLMSERAIRRLPVIEGDRPVGIVSIGDLSMERNVDSTLEKISAAPGDR